MKLRIPYSSTGIDFKSYHSNGHGTDHERDETYELTELGKEKAGDYAAEGPRLRVLLCLSGGPKSAGEIAGRTGIAAERVVAILEDFAALQWIRRRMG